LNHVYWELSRTSLFGGILCVFSLAAQDAPTTVTPAPDPERWNLYWQATSIGQIHPGFQALYSGPLSLSPYAEAEASLTTTIFFGLRLAKNTEFYFDPEIAGGRGFSNTNGVANFPNGEMPRVATATPKPYLARLYVTQDFGFGDATETVDSDANQLGGTRPATRYTINVGRFSATDFFDNNAYTHDPRTQFMGWAIMYNGAWDYPADTRGYTWGWVHEFHTPRYSFRYGSFAEPRVANGLRFDRQIFVNRGDTLEGEADYKPHGHAGAVRFLSYFNRTNSGRYADAIQLGEETHTAPDITAVRHPGTLKWGFGANMEQEIVKDVGVFARWGWNNGTTESFVFTAMDRLYQAGISLKGTRWHRPNDVVATGFTAAGLAPIHAEYLARGGLDFLIGDGALNYGKEMVSESYYSALLVRGFFATVDLQHINNPAYNRDRGPVWVASLRLHLEYGKK
jgi:high affinity Mn2+ porin